MFEHFVFLLAGIYRNQHWYTCWYIFTCLPITGTKVSIVPDCNVKYKHTHTHQHMLAHSSIYGQTANDNNHLCSDQQSHVCVSLSASTQNENISLSVDHFVCVMLVNCLNVYKFILSYSFHFIESHVNVCVHVCTNIERCTLHTWYYTFRKTKH